MLGAAPLSWSVTDFGGAGMARRIFVFGSNLAGRHGAGAAKTAREQYGAVQGTFAGRTGDAYAIPTKDTEFRPRSLGAIEVYVNDFIQYALDNPHLIFDVTRLGCGLAGYTDEQIAPMFAGSPANVILPKAWGGEGFDW